ncbi:MAG TPA: zinc ribbon domain-containing protein, partial [Pyrinomonadaceae bacterium]
MNCPQCGVAMKEGTQFCGACGYRLTQAQASQPAAVKGGGTGQGINLDQDARGQGRGYSWEVLHQPAFSLAIVRLQA